MQDMLVKLYDLPYSISDLYQMNLELEKKGIVIRKPLAPEKKQVVNWVGCTFGKLWGSEMDVAFSNQTVSAFIAIKEQEIAGFSCYDTTCKNFFGPTGVDEKYRGMGLGKILLLEALFAMKHAGYAYCIIGGVGPIEFYEKAANAVIIEGSDSSIYKGLLKDEK